MGVHEWDIHRWVVCEQSSLLQKKWEHAETEVRDLQIQSSYQPQERQLTHSKQIRHDRPHAVILIEDKTLTQAGIRGLLKFLYTHTMENQLAKNPVKAYLLADDFGITKMRQTSLEYLEKALQTLINVKYWCNYRHQARKKLFLCPFQSHLPSTQHRYSSLFHPKY